MKIKKSLGQNFLKSEPALKKIIEAGEIKNTDTILEIGPGKGALTKKLLENALRVVAIEKDNELFIFLQEKFSGEIKNGKLVLLNQDILDLEIKEIAQIIFSGPRISLKPAIRGRFQPTTGQTNSKITEPFLFKIIANIPYNITGAILKKFLTEKNQPELMVLMVQHEVAKRIVANDKKESILSISVKAYGDPKMIMKVPARYFSPAPKVDSAIISIKNISRKLFTPTVQSSTLHSFEERFWEIVKTGFAHKRKKLSGNLKSLNFLEKNDLENLKNKRAEDLSLEDWIKLAEISTKS